MLAVISELLTTLATWFAAYGYVGLFIVSFIAAFAFPIPSSIALAGSGALAASGTLNLYYVLGIALAANILADILGFMLARRYGRSVIQSIGLGFLFRTRVYKWLDSYVEEFPQSIIYTTRLMTEAGPAVNVLIGLSSVRVRTFLLFDVLGEASYVLLFGLAGYFLGDAWQSNSDFLFKGLLVLVSFGAVGGAAQYVLKLRTNTNTSE